MATDQEIRDRGFKYIPKQEYLLNPFELPVEPESPVVNQGIVNTNAFTGGGGDDFSVYNPDPNSIVNRNYKPNYDYRQASEINSRTFNPQPYGTGVQRAQSQYNLALNNITNSGPMTPERQAEVLRTRNDIIQDNRQNYGAEGQFVDQYDPRYSSVTEAQKFMDNFPEYYGLDQTGPSKMEGLMNLIPYAGSFVRGAKFLGNQISPYLPVNRRAILENELGGQGILVNNIGQIVQGQGDYNTAENVMAGYNANRMTVDTFNDRINSIKNRKRDQTDDSRKRIAAIEAAKANFLAAQDKTDKIYDFEEDKKEKKKKDTIVGRYITKRNEKKAAKEAEEAEAAAAAAKNTGGRSYDAPGGVTSSNYNQAANISGGGGGNTARNSQGQTAREATYDGNKNTGTSQGYSQHYAKGGRAGYFYGGRVNFKNGGLASIL